jgi:ERCC4-related helicase
MSATQAMTPLDMRAFGYATKLHRGMNHTKTDNWGMKQFKAFMESAGAEFTGRFGAMYFDSSKPENVAKLQAIHRELFEVKKMASRMKREDFGDIFAHNQIECTPYDMGAHGAKIARVYEDMQMELARLEKHSENYSQHIFAVLTKARRLAELYKVPTLCELADDMMDEGKSVIIFVNYTESIEALYSRLAKTYGADMIGQVHGNQTFKQRHDDIAAFQGDRKRIMLCNITAGGECIDLQDLTGRFPRVAFINPSYRAISVLQCIGRADRAGAKSDILTNLVLANGTIEVSVGAKFNCKKGHLDILNDGDFVPDGISFTTARHVAGMDV